MTYDLALAAVLIGAGYWGQFFVRRRPHGSATFGIMLLAAAALSGLGMLGRKLALDGFGWLGVAGAIGVGAGTCLLVIGPLVRLAARWLVGRERMGLALRLLGIADVLAPGSGVAQDKALIRAMADVRDGRIEQTVDVLTAARERASDDARLAIDERIAMLYLGAYRWSDAIAHAEAHLFGAPPPQDAPDSLRGALGVAPPVWVDLLGAYGRIGDLEQAARMVARLEDVCAGRSDAALWIHRARLMFLALAGRTDAVRALVAPRQARHMTAAARSYWIAVAHEHGGDRAAAARAYAKARSGLRGRPRELVDRALAGLDEAQPAALDGVTSEVIARLEAAPLPPTVAIPRARGARATWLLTASLVAVAAVTAVWVGDTSDVGALVRAGALVHGLVDAGQRWRLITCVFVHDGGLHLAVNAVGLIVIGRLTEGLFDTPRTVAIFGLSGIAGSVASYLASPTGIMSGASGAVFGLLGAAFIEITWHRAHYRAAWKQGLWGGLAVVTLAQLGFGFFDPMIDQWSHGGGLLTGAVLGVVLSPSARWPRTARFLGRALAVAFVAAVALSAGLAASTSLAQSAGFGAPVRQPVPGIELRAPAGWVVAHDPNAPTYTVSQPDGLAQIRLGRTELRAAPAEQIDAWIAATVRGARKIDGFGDVAAAPTALFALPSGWRGGEQIVLDPEDSLGHRQRWRWLLCGRAFGDQVILVAIQLPETIARADAEFAARLLASIGPA